MSNHETKEIEPALTPEEWKERAALDRHDEGIAIEATGLVALYDDGAGTLYLERPASVMALANAALPDGDPRKITRKDVDLLRLLLRAFAPDDKVRDWLPALADKLAMLLPPE